MPNDFTKILEKRRKRAQKQIGMLHPADRKALAFYGLKEGKSESEAFKKIAGVPGSYTTAPGGRIKRLPKKTPTWKSGESVKKRDKRLFTPPE